MHALDILRGGMKNADFLFSALSGPTFIVQKADLAFPMTTPMKTTSTF